MVVFSWHLSGKYVSETSERREENYESTSTRVPESRTTQEDEYVISDILQTIISP